jgi:hypothetical protein
MEFIVRSIFALAIIGFLIPFGLWTAYKGALLTVEASQSASWPTADGQIIASQVRRAVTQGRHSGRSYEPAIDYTYAVAGTNYTGTMVAPGRTWGSKSSYAAVKLHPSGAKAVVCYDPANPSTSVLNPGLHAASFGRMLLGLFVTTFGSIFALLIVSQSPSRAGRSWFQSDTLGGRLVLPLVGLLVAEIVAMIWIS